MTRLFIYQDYVHNNGGLWAALAIGFGAENVQYIDSNDIKNNILQEQPKALLIPGGASRYVSDKLNGTGNSKIKEYVSNGGLYIGICAGAYYACQRTEWHLAEGPVFSVENELGFFPGTAHGPITPNPSIERIETEKGNIINGLNWWGPRFESDQPNAFTTLAHYVDLPGQPAAIVSGQYGQGRYLLLSPHLEIDDTQLAQLQFNVVENRMQELAGLPTNSSLSKNNFINLIKEFIK